MPEIDMSTRVAVRASAILRRVRDRVNVMVPLGPMQMKLTPSETLAHINAMQPAERMQYAQMIGVDKFLREMQELEMKVHGRNT